MNTLSHDERMKLVSESEKAAELEKFLTENGVNYFLAHSFVWLEWDSFIKEIEDEDDHDIERLFAALAKKCFDGHYTIFRFTTGYKAAFGTPDLRTGQSSDHLYEGIVTRETIREAMLSAILNEDCFYPANKESVA